MIAFSKKPSHADSTFVTLQQSVLSFGGDRTHLSLIQGLDDCLNTLDWLDCRDGLPTRDDDTRDEKLSLLDPVHEKPLFTVPSVRRKGPPIQVPLYRHNFQTCMGVLLLTKLVFLGVLVKSEDDNESLAQLVSNGLPRLCVSEKSECSMK